MRRKTTSAAIDPANIRKDTTPVMTTEAPTTDQAVNPVPVTPPDLATLEANLAKAEAALATANGNITQAAATNNIPGMIAAGKEIETANKAIDAANKAITRASYETRSAERNAATDTLKGIADSLAAAIDIPAYVKLSITGFSVTFTDDGTATVNVNVKGAPKTSSGEKAPKATVGGGRVQWHYQGGVLTGREMVELYGEDSDKARIVKADNWKEDGQKYFPGIDSTVKMVAKRIGATGEKGGVAIEL